MADFLPARQLGALPSLSERRVSRYLDRLGAQTSVEAARVRAIERVETAKIEAIGAVTAVALMEVSSLSATEAILFERTPHAAGRLKFIADSGAAGMADVVTRLSKELR